MHMMHEARKNADKRFSTHPSV